MAPLIPFGLLQRRSSFLSPAFDMKLLTLRAKSYRSLRNEDIALGDLNLFIGANASGKSTILDAFRFLNEGVRAREFRTPTFSRGGILHLAWKGAEADRIELVVRLEHEGKCYEWTLRLVRTGYEFYVEYLLNVQGRVQFMVTTHSPLLLDFLNRPEVVRVVQHDEKRGTTVVTEENPNGVRRALEASGLGLGEFYETKGFGSN